MIRYFDPIISNDVPFSFRSEAPQLDMMELIFRQILTMPLHVMGFSRYYFQYNLNFVESADYLHQYMVQGGLDGISATILGGCDYYDSVQVLGNMLLCELPVSCSINNDLRTPGANASTFTVA